MKPDLALRGLGTCLLGMLVACNTAGKDYEKAKQADTIEAYEQFVSRHPGSEHHPSAADRLEELRAARDWALAQKSENIALYDAFLAQHPKSRDSAEAKRRLGELVAVRAYKYKSGFGGATGARRITVRSMADGLEVRAGPVTFLAKPGQEVEMTPRDARLTFAMGGAIGYDPGSMGLTSSVSLQFRDGVALPALLLLAGGAQGLQPRGIKAVFPDAARSSEVTLAIDPAIGATAHAGLRFASPCVVAVSADGRVELDREGITATDSSGASWASRSLTGDGSSPFVLVKSNQEVVESEVDSGKAPSDTRR